MMLDPVTIRELSDIKVREMLQQAETSRQLKAVGATETSFINFFRATVSRWMQPLVSDQPAPAYEVKRATAEIPGL